MTVQLLFPTMEVGVVTTNLEPMIAFYEGYLGLPLQAELAFPGGMQRRYEVGRNVLKLVTYDQPPSKPGMRGGGHAQEGILYFSLFVKDIAAVAADFEASPHEIVEPLTKLVVHVRGRSGR